MDLGGATQPRQRAMLVPLLDVAAIAVALAYVQALHGLLATLAFSALAAILSRAIPALAPAAAASGKRLALTLTIVAYILILVLLGGRGDRLGPRDRRPARRASRPACATHLAALADAFAAATGLPTGSVPAVDAAAIIAGACARCSSTVGPAVTSLLMSVLIVIYLLLDADNLRARMLRTRPPRSWPLRRPGERARRLHQGPGDARRGRRRRRHDPAARARRPVRGPVGRALVPVQLRPQHRVHPRARPADGVRATRARARPGDPRRRRLRRDQPRVRLRAPAADHGRPTSTSARSSSIVVDPRLDGGHRAGRRAARRAADDRAAGRRSCRSRAPAGSSRCSGRSRARPEGDPSLDPTIAAVPDPDRRRRPRDRPRLPPLRVAQPAGRGGGPRLDDRRRGRARVPRRRGRRDRRQRRPRPTRDRRRRSPSRPARLSYAHGSAFTTEALERYAAELGPHLPVDDPAIYPVSGGSEAIETALKLARATQLARGERGPLDRVRALGQLPRQHARRARPVRAQARSAARTRAGSAGSGTSARRTRTAAASSGSQALGTTQELVDELDRAISVGRAAAPCARSSASRSSGRRWPRSSRPRATGRRIADVCRHHGVLLIADEVMTGFGRTGTWFGMDHYGVRPDLLVAAKGATSGYWPFGFVAASGEVYDAVTGGGGFVHGFTYSHQPVAATVAREVLRILEAESLVEASATKGERLKALAGGPASASTRPSATSAGRGLMVGVELVRDRETREPFPRAAKLVEAVVRIARERGLLLYSGTGQRERRRRRRHPARPAVRDHGRRARADRRRARRGAGPRARRDRGAGERLTRGRLGPPGRPRPG